MKRVKLLMALLVTFLSCNVQMVNAETGSNDGIQVEVDVNQEAYEEGAEVIVTATVTNTNDFEVNGVNISALIPEGFTAQENKDIYIEVLNAGETKKLEVTLVKEQEIESSKEPTTSENNSEQNNSSNQTSSSGQSNSSSQNSASTNSSTSLKNSENTNVNTTIEIATLTPIEEQAVAQVENVESVAQKTMHGQAEHESKATSIAESPIKAETEEEEESTQELESTESVVEEESAAEEESEEKTDFVEIEEEQVAEAQNSNNATWIWIILILLVIVAGVVVILYKKGKKGVAVILIIVMAGTLVAPGNLSYVQAAKSTKAFQVVESFNYAGSEYEVGVQIEYLWKGKSITLSTNVSEFSINQSGTTLYFYASMDFDAQTVALYEQSSSEKIAVLVDDGKYTQSGDDIPNDGIYSAKIKVTPQEDTEYQYYVVATDMEGSYTSNTIAISAYTTLLNSDMDDMEQVDKALLALIQSVEFTNASLEEKKNKVNELLLSLADTLNKAETGTLIVKESIYYDDVTAMYTFSYGCGVYGGVMLEGFDEELDGIDTVEIQETEEQTKVEEEAGIEEQTEIAVVEEQTKVEEEAVEEQTEVEEEAVEEQTEVEEEAVEEQTKVEEEAVEEQTEVEEEMVEVENEAELEETVDEESIRTETDFGENFLSMIEYPLDAVSFFNAKAAVDYSVADAAILYSRGAGDATDSIFSNWKNVNDTLTNANVDVSLDSDVTVADYMTAFSGKDLVLIHSHGSRISYRTGFLWLDKHTESAICLRDKTSVDEDKIYKDDLKQHRLFKAHKSEGTFYWVLPSFFTYYYGQDGMDNAMVYLGFCLGFGDGTSTDETLANAILACGASTVMGYHNSVYTYYNIKNATEIVNGLVQGDRIGNAYDNALILNGSDDIIWGNNNSIDTTGHAVATPQFRGNRDRVLFASALENGNFDETGNIATAKWEKVGDARIITKLAELSPQSGSNMAIITTGLGSGEESYLLGTEGSSIYQTFRVPEGTKSLSFSYDVVSEEPMEYVGSSYDDKFVAQLLNEQGELICELAFESVNTSTWHEIKGINFEGGDSTTYHTTWKQVDNTEISNYAGQYVTIRFAVWDMKDSVYDTAALIDCVQLN